MTSHARNIINAGLVSRGLLPMDGDCACIECGRTGLTRRQMSADSRFGHPVCIRCAEQILSGYVTCCECGGHGGGRKRFDRARGVSVTEWCERCNGYGSVHVGVPAHLRDAT